MRSLLLFALAQLLCGRVSAQQVDSSRPSGGSMPPGPHAWEAIRTDPAVPAFERGKALAIEGRLAEAEQEFRKGFRIRKALAQFNLGILDYERAKYRSACRHFRIAYRMKQDPAFLDSLRNTRRLAAAHPRKR